MHNSTTKSLLIMTSLLTPVLLGLLAFDLHSLKTKNENASSLKAEADQDLTEEIALRALESSQSETKNDLVNLSKFVLSEDTLVSFIELVENSGKSLGLKVKTNSVSKDAPDKKDILAPAKIHVAVETAGSWSKTLTFIHLLESLPYQVTFDSSTLSKMSVGTSTTWSSRTALTVYSFVK